MTVKLLIEHNLEFLSLKWGCTGSFESTLVKMPHCWKSHAMTQINSASGHLIQNRRDRIRRIDLASASLRT